MNCQVHRTEPDDACYDDEYPLQEQFENLGVNDVFYFDLYDLQSNIDMCQEQFDDNVFDK